PPILGLGLPPRESYWDARILPYAVRNKAVFLCPGLTLSNAPVTVSNNWNDFLTTSIIGRFFQHPNESYGFNTWGVGLDPLDYSGGLGLGGRSLGLNAVGASPMLSVFGTGPGYPPSAIVAPGDMIA